MTVQDDSQHDVKSVDQLDRGRCKCSRVRLCFLVMLLLSVILSYYMDYEVSLNWILSLGTFYSNRNINTSAQITHSVQNKTTTTVMAPVPITSTESAQSTVKITTQLPKRLTPAPPKPPNPYTVAYPNDYHFIINEPERCLKEKPFLVLLVPVAPNNRAARNAVRSTWGSEREVLGKMVSLFFVLALPPAEGRHKVQEEVLQESKEHHDLLQSDFLDCYKNLTIKTMVMLEWLSSNCSNAFYAMKVDSDIFLNVHNLVEMLIRAPRQNYLTGLVAKGGAVLRNPASKWYLPHDIFPESVYPPYALGLGYVLSLDLPSKLTEAAKHVTAVYIEDVYIGLCMRYLRVSPTDPPNPSLFNVFPVPYNRCRYAKLIATTTHSLTDQVNFWKDLKKPGPPCS
ncbi:beta-1,3-galactosyltransferase 1 [Chanos chanos]|uniref:Hexosyltransferase n=1 Tax=Chanos chanos TaxID=29144 RepID=A0A6J2UP16_CHACN|nr:beta-1,3-galactosyltransferase 1-like [Chanos chanos]